MYGLHPQKKLGQNFLIDARLLESIVTMARVGSRDTVLEVGAGIGNLTHAIASKARSVIAVEKDRRLIPILRESIKEFSNVTIVEADIREFDPAPHVKERFKVIGNIPYYLTGHFFKILSERWPRPELVVLTIQKEVAYRIVAKEKGTKEKPSLLSLSVQLFGNPEIIRHISRKKFWPAPQVDSSLIVVTPRNHDSAEAQKIMSIAKQGFSQKRKKLNGNLSRALNISRQTVRNIFHDLNIPDGARAEHLSVDQWEKLAARLMLVKNNLRETSQAP